MPKMKTCSAAKKRFKKIGSTKLIKRSQALRRHLLTKKTTKRKRHLRSTAYVCKNDMRAIARLLPN